MTMIIISPWINVKQRRFERLWAEGRWYVETLSGTQDQDCRSSNKNWKMGSEHYRTTFSDITIFGLAIIQFVWITLSSETKWAFLSRFNGPDQGALFLVNPSFDITDKDYFLCEFIRIMLVWSVITRLWIGGSSEKSNGLECTCK